MTAKVDSKTSPKPKKESPLEELLAQQIRFVNLPIPQREFRFAPPRRYRADFAYPDRMLLIEVEGGIWTGGRHSRGSGFENDCSKYNLATTMGYRVLRFTGDMIKSGLAIRAIEQVYYGKNDVVNRPKGQVTE